MAMGGSMDQPERGARHPLPLDLKAEILSGIQALRPLSALFPAFFAAEQKRVSLVRHELAALDAEIRECCAKRDAAARRLVALAGKERPVSAPENATCFLRAAS
jgi:hypothetical protein